MIIHKWISSDGSELVPTTDVKINFTVDDFYDPPCPNGIHPSCVREFFSLFFKAFFVCFYLKNKTISFIFKLMECESQCDREGYKAQRLLVPLAEGDRMFLPR
jgi:hypothetical protein